MKFQNYVGETKVKIRNMEFALAIIIIINTIYLSSFHQGRIILEKVLFKIKNTSLQKMLPLIITCGLIKSIVQRTFDFQ